ncbi:hypothetical protein MKW98_012114, partial [Papaver atlanticum]
ITCYVMADLFGGGFCWCFYSNLSLWKDKRDYTPEIIHKQEVLPLNGSHY